MPILDSVEVHSLVHTLMVDVGFCVLTHNRNAAAATASTGECQAATTSRQHVEDKLCMTNDSTRTVLILDDDEYTRKFVVALLTNVGYSVTEARTGRDASHEMRKRRFDLVIVDYRLPDCDGLSWISLHRGAGCDTPFMCTSAPILGAANRAN